MYNCFQDLLPNWISGNETHLITFLSHKKVLVQFLEYFFIIYQVELVRRRTPVLLQVYLTTGLFVIVSWISFIVPPEVVPG